jgi:hypothetical protein
LAAIERFATKVLPLARSVMSRNDAQAYRHSRRDGPARTRTRAALGERGLSSDDRLTERGQGALTAREINETVRHDAVVAASYRDAAAAAPIVLLTCPTPHSAPPWKKCAICSRAKS